MVERRVGKSKGFVHVDDILVGGCCRRMVEFLWLLLKEVEYTGVLWESVEKSSHDSEWRLFFVDCRDCFLGDDELCARLEDVIGCSIACQSRFGVFQHRKPAKRGEANSSVEGGWLKCKEDIPDVEDSK